MHEDMGVFIRNRMVCVFAKNAQRVKVLLQCLGGLILVFVCLRYSFGMISVCLRNFIFRKMGVFYMLCACKISNPSKSYW